MIQSVPFGSPPPQSAGDHDGQTLLVSDLRALIASGNSQPSTPPERTSPVLLLPGQGRVVLDRNAVVGTRPQLSRVQGSNLPHLVTVPSPSGEISRNHLELRVEGSNVLVVDLNSTNGTVLLRAGSEPVRLHPGEPSMLVAGDRLDLGDGMVLGFEGLA
jgi:pSer/pThr/pTyr-binding forkhead associated (FHA) protein